MEDLMEGEQLLRHMKAEQVSANVRGRFLNQAVFIEMLLAEIICHHFCPDKQRRFQFFDSIVSNMTFNTRVDVFSIILKSFYSDIEREYPDIVKQINDIRNFRNIVAHALLDTSSEFLDNNPEKETVQFVTYKRSPGKRTKEIKHLLTNDDFKKKIQLTESIISRLAAIRDKVAHITD
jgi:hypothetical protein